MVSSFIICESLDLRGECSSCVRPFSESLDSLGDLVEEHGVFESPGAGVLGEAGTVKAPDEGRGSLALIVLIISLTA